MMSRWRFIALFVLLAACGTRQVSDGEDGPAKLPEWSPCVSKDEAETCEEVCAASGMTCVSNGCPANPEFCDPEPCNTATQALALDAGALCADASVGRFVASTCDAPVEWLFSNTLRCCCAEED